MQNTTALFPLDPGLFHRQLEHLLALAPRIHQALGEETPLDELPGWRELVSKPHQLIMHQGRPCLVSVLFGPSGAGKSTIFNLLTGIDVPRGEVRRPMTHNCVAAVPRALKNLVELAAMFPGYDPLPLSDPAVLKNAPQPASQFYYAYYEPAESSEAWLILADVPDFNTVERENWIKAKKMLSRSEIVIFTVHPEAYKDEAVISHLLFCCKNAGHLAYVLTKLPPENRQQTAEEIWLDLMQYARHAPQFQILREDGRSAWAFLNGASVYFAPRRASLDICEIQPLDGATPEFLSLLKGRSGTAIYWTNLLEAADAGVSSVALLAKKAMAARTTLENALELAEKHIHQASERIAGTQFPAGELVETIIETVKKNRPGWLRMLSVPLSSAAGLFSSTRKMMSRLRGKDRQQMLKDRNVLEKERLAEAVEVLIAQWRSDFSSEATSGLLQAGNCRQAAEAFAQKKLPEARSEWKEAVRLDVRDWAQKNRWYGSLLGTLSEMLVLLGGTALVLDLAFSGGLTHLGVVAAAGAGSVGAGTVLKLFEELKMKDILEKADMKWRSQRSSELAGHLRTHFADPLFGNAWRRKMEKLSAAEPEACVRVCESLRSQWMAC